MHPYQRLGHEADGVAGLGTAGFDSLRNSLGDDLRVAEHVAAELLAHTLGSLCGLLLIGTTFG